MQELFLGKDKVSLLERGVLKKCANLVRCHLLKRLSDIIETLVLPDVCWTIQLEHPHNSNSSLIRELTGSVGLLPQEGGPGTDETDQDISVLHQLRNVLRPAGGGARMVRLHPLRSLLTPASGNLLVLRL